MLTEPPTVLYARSDKGSRMITEYLDHIDKGCRQGRDPIQLVYVVVSSIRTDL